MTSECRVLDHVIWDDAVDMTMKEFVNYFREDADAKRRDGILMETTSGYMGCDLMHEVESEEVYWVYEIKQQRRLVVTDSRKRYLSIPTNYPLKMNVVDWNGKNLMYGNKEASSVREICDGLSRGDSIPCLMFDGDPRVSFNVGSNQGGKARVGLLDIVDSYNEKFLLAFPILDRKISEKPTAIPAYMPITVTVALKFRYSDDLKMFDKWLDDVAEITASIPRQRVDTCREIIVIDKKPDGGHYEYIKPTSAVYASGGPTASSRSADRDSHGSQSVAEWDAEISRTYRILPPLPPDRRRRPPPEIPPDTTAAATFTVASPDAPPLPPRHIDSSVPPPIPRRCMSEPGRGATSAHRQRRPRPALPLPESFGDGDGIGRPAVALQRASCSVSSEMDGNRNWVADDKPDVRRRSSESSMPCSGSDGISRYPNLKVAPDDPDDRIREYPYKHIDTDQLEPDEWRRPSEPSICGGNDGGSYMRLMVAPKDADDRSHEHPYEQVVRDHLPSWFDVSAGSVTGSS